MQNPFQTDTDAKAAINDPLAFITKLWGDMQLPGMVTPTISVDDLDKQIKDLKTVESWLNVNMNMLRGTIQALEVQRATISALKAMGESFAHVNSGKTPAKHTETEQTRAEWPMHQNQGTVSEAQADLENEMDDAEDMEPDSSSTEAANNQAADTAPAGDVDTNASAGGFSNPGAWWNLLQEQFKQALGNALQEEQSQSQEQTRTKRKANSTTTTKSTSARAGVKKKSASSTAVDAKPKTSSKLKSAPNTVAAKKTVKTVKPVVRKSTQNK